MTVCLVVFCISAAAIALEVLLMRLLSIIQWHHLAYLIISLALLGFGASGTFLALTRARLVSRPALALQGNCLLFSLTAFLGFLAVEHIPLNLLEIIWNKQQFLYLLQHYILLALPFFFAANCTGLSFICHPDKIHQIYCCNMVGAGVGAVGVILLLKALHPMACLLIVAGVGLPTAAILDFSSSFKKGVTGLALTAMVAGLMVAFFPSSWLALDISEYKALSKTLLLPQARVILERSSPLGWLAVVESPVIPFRYAPGMSLNCTAPLPGQLGVFTDGDSFTPITRFDGKREGLEFLDCLPAALPYHVLAHPQVLVLDAGGGMEVLMALYYRATSVTAVEPNPQLAALLSADLADFSGRLYALANVRINEAEARNFVERHTDRYDLVVLSAQDSSASAMNVGAGLSQTYGLTIEALQAYLSRLQPGGLFAATSWYSVPPRGSLKLFVTAVEALRRFGVQNPERSLALVHSWGTATLLVKNGWFSEKELHSVRDFCEQRGFDLAYLPGVKQEEVNRYNVLDRPYFYEGAMALLGDGREDFLRRYKLDIAPATDDRPYFYHFFKWRILPEILSLQGKEGWSMTDWSFPLLLATLLLAVIGSALLIFIPLFFLPGRGACGGQAGPVAAYFLLLGFAFILVELAFIQKFTLYLGHPVYAAATVIAAFLMFAGGGSLFSATLEQQFLAEHRARGLPVVAATGGIAVVAIAVMVWLPHLSAHLLTLSDVCKVLVCGAIIAPLAFCMGVPFPLGLARVTAKNPQLVPWAWGINGCASVVGAVLAAIVAIHGGFNVVLGLGLLMYAAAAVSLWSFSA